MHCAGVFFAATIPFVFVLVVGLVGISQINEQIDSVPARESTCAWIQTVWCVISAFMVCA